MLERDMTKQELIKEMKDVGYQLYKTTKKGMYFKKEEEKGVKTISITAELFIHKHYSNMFSLEVPCATKKHEIAIITQLMEELEKEGKNE